MLEVTENFVLSWNGNLFVGNLGWKYKSSCSCLEKVDRSFCSEKCQFHDQNYSQKFINFPKLLYTLFFFPTELKCILLNLLTLNCLAW